MVALALRVVAVLVVLCGIANAQVRRVAEMTADELRALDRQRTAVLLVGGILEEHGPYLPSFTDGYGNERFASDLAEAIAARPGWTALVFPTIPLGTGGANELGGLFSFPGTYAVRSSTLRSVFMDLADELGEQGFRTIFIVHTHGAPNQNRALDDAGDYFGATYGGRMTHLGGLEPVWNATASLTEDQARDDGFGVHGGTRETSAMLALRPSLVRDGFTSAPSVTVEDWSGILRAAGSQGWTGYIGAPRHASVAIGERHLRIVSDAMTEVAMEIIDGADPRQFRRWGDLARESQANVAADAAALAEEARRGAVQRAWLDLRGIR